MVKIFPVRSVKSTTEEEMAPLSSPSNKIPNRFRSKIYDRSVFSGDDCVKAFGGPCKCFTCCQYPVVVVSAGESICDQYNITCRNIKEFLDGGLLEPLIEESFIIYGQETECGQMQIGILAALDVEDCLNNIVKRHELCIPEHDTPVSTKLKQYQSMYVDPIMIMYRQNEIIDEIVTRVISEDEPIPILNKVHNEKAGRHHLWAVKDVSDIIALQTAFETVESLYIADGHHRTAAACKMMSSPRPTRKGAPVQPSSRYITALIFPDTQLNVLSFNRCVKSLTNLDELQFLEAISEKFRIVKLEGEVDSSSSNRSRLTSFASSLTTAEDFESRRDSISEDSTGSGSQTTGKVRSDSESSSSVMNSSEVDEIQMYYRGEWYQLFAFNETYNDIDAQILVDHLFKPILNMSYPESEKNMVYVDGRQGRQGIENCVNEGKAVVGFCVRRVSTRAIMEIADEGRLLPPKATFFDPKPLAGLLLRLKR
eukprot:gene6509-7009_t